MRILADVNVVVSSAIAPLGMPRAIIEAWQAESIGLVTADGIIAEVDEKLHSTRIRTKYHLTEALIGTAIDLLRMQAEVVRVPARAVVPVTGDPEDDYVLAAAVQGRVDYLVTGDKGLLALGSYQGIPIVSPREFLRLFHPAES